MSILTDALTRANARKDSVWEGKVGRIDHDDLLLLLSGTDIDPADLAGYMDAAVNAFAVEAALGEDEPDTILHGLLAEGLLMGMMIERVANTHPQSDPSIQEAASTLARLVWERWR